MNGPLGRIGRLFRAEMLKLRAHPFLPFAAVLLVAATLAGALAPGALTGAEPSAWRPTSAMQVFAGGARHGLKMASFLLVIFGSLMVAGEFDRGTIKVLLTRPITRTDLFASKCLAGFLLAGLFVVGVLGLSFGAGCLVGELGPVWARDNYLRLVSWEAISDHAWMAIRLSVPATLAAVFLGIAVSSLVESSGFAVAIALGLFLGLDIGLGLAGEGAQRLFIGYYPTYAFDVLRQFADGTAARWDSAVARSGRWWYIPTATAGIGSTLAYAVFRMRNIIA